MYGMVNDCDEQQDDEDEENDEAVVFHEEDHKMLMDLVFTNKDKHAVQE